MNRKPACAAAVASALLLAATGTALADSGGQEGTAPTGHATPQMQDGSEMQGAGMDHGSPQAGTTGVADRPEVLVLGGFALANVIVLLAAAVVRHRDRSRPGRERAVPGEAR